MVKVEDLEKDDVVVVAFGGSPFKEKLACVEGVGQADSFKVLADSVEVLNFL